MMGLLLRWFLVLLHFKPGDLIPVYLIRSVGEANYTGVRVGMSEAKIIRDPATAMHLYRPIDDLAGHVRSRNLDHADFLARFAIAKPVHLIGGGQHQQAGLVDENARLGDTLARDALFRK